MTRSSGPALDAWSGVDPRSVASWYTEGLSDGIGDRLLMFDNSDHASLELLRFRPELASAPGFEDALRARVAELRAFSHPAFPEIRAIQHLENGGLVLVSTIANGKRLSEVFRNQRTRSGVHPAFGAWLVRQLASSLADLQRHNDTVAHTSLTPDRIVVTPDGRVMIVEHVLGSALDTLKLTSARHWHEFGALAPPNGDGTARLDRRTDVIQLGWIVLSALIGRRATTAEYPGRVEALVDQFERNAGPRSPALVGPLRRWLERALQVSGDAFASAIDAHAALVDLPIDGGPQAIPFAAQHALEAPAPPKLHLAPVQTAALSDGSLPGDGLQPIAYTHTKDGVDLSDSEHETMTAVTDVIAGGRERSRADAAAPDDRAGTRTSFSGKLGWAVAAVLGVVVAAETVALARLSAAPATPPAVSAPIVFDSPTPGDAVVVNGKTVGVTPLKLTLTPDIKSVRVEAQSSLDRVEVKQALATAVPDTTTNTTAQALADARARRGGLRLVSPVEVQVLEGERVLGSSADGPIVAAAGVHELDFINPAVGFRQRQTVTIRAGEITKMNVAMPDGRVSVNAVPWAQVWINGALAGDTPLANLPLPVGEHQITFKHPQLGEQTQRVVVKTGALTRVSATMTR